MSYAPIWAKPALQHQSKLANSSIPFLSDPAAKVTQSRCERTLTPRQPRPKQKNDWPIIVHCHLCWDWVWQRPQQFLSRLSWHHKILFVETLSPDAQLTAPVARFYVPQNFPNVAVLQIQFPAWRWSDGAYVDAER